MTTKKPFLCPFYLPSRAYFGIRVCDNLVSGVPHCVVNEFYPDLPYEEELVRFLSCVPDVEICSHFVRSDVYFPSELSAKSGCCFGGACVNPSAVGFGACVGCSRFRSGV